MISDQSSITVPQDSHKMETKLTRVVFGPDPESGVENVKVSLNTCIVDVQSFGDKHKHGSCAEPHTNGIIYKWYHASQNSTELVNSVCSKSLSVDMSSAVRQIWVSKERLASIGPSSKVPPFMSPFVRTITSQGNVTQREKCTVIVLPYLATENLTAIISRQRTIDSLLSGSRVFLPGYNPPILDPLPTHLPRTLSQFLYPTLSETAEQIIKQKRSGINQDSTGCLMAHQLWLITVGEECVVTLFPQMEDNETGVTSSLYGNISRNLQEIKFSRSVCSHVIDIAAIMVQEAVMLVHKSREGSLSLLHQYHSLLGNMRQDYYATLAAFKDEQENVSGCLSSEAEGNELLSKVLDASTLQTETWSVKRLVESQIQVVKALLDEVRGQNPETIEHEVGFSVCKNTIKLAEELSEHLDRLSQEIDQVKVDLLNMFDLQQKRASLRASHAAVEQTNSSLELAKNSARQSRVMTVFTAMTVIFLPLSLIASIFSMQVKEYTSQDGPTLSLATYWIYAMPISIVTILSALAWAYPSELREFMSSHYKKMKDMLQTMIL